MLATFVKFIWLTGLLNYFTRLFYLSFSFFSLCQNCFSCFIGGASVDPMQLLSPVTFPVPRGTPMISPLVAWDHGIKWAVPKPEEFLGGGSGKMNDAKFEVSIAGDSEDKYIEGTSSRVVFAKRKYEV